ncbi:MAG: hypothetical protein ACLRP3_08800 [Escherichia sp.]
MRLSANRQGNTCAERA